MPRAMNRKSSRHESLYQSIENTKGVLRTKERGKRERAVDDDGPTILSKEETRTVLAMARQQQLEVAYEDANVEDSSKHDYRAYREPTGEEKDSESEAYDSDDDYSEFNEIQDIDVNPEEDAIFEKYMMAENNSLAGEIMNRMGVAGVERRKVGLRSSDQKGVMLPPKVIAVYTQIGELLSRYKSGKLPRAFRIIPTLRNWRDVLYVTQPENWSDQALYEGTVLFVSNLRANQALRFIRDILYDRFRVEVHTNKTVSYHLYRALKKALYRPAAFFKGFLFPLCESGNCTLKEATIAASILTRVSIPALHSAAALLHLAEMPYSGAASLFIRVLLDKKYALPYKVVDAMVFHFVRFRQSPEETLPVIWHQSLLAFAQRYKNDITDDQREALLAVIRLKPHPKISPEINRELRAGHPRVEEVEMQLETNQAIVENIQI